MSEAVRAMFGRIANRYDRANTVLSLGLHSKWRRRLVQLAVPPRGGDALDVATGTGDVALELRRAVGRSGRVVGIDFSPPMLELARSKAERMGLRVELREGDALRLEFPDQSFDVAAIAFGIRNLDDPARGLKEMARVVRPGGRVAVLEFGQPRGLLKWPYRAYSRLVIPVMGTLLTGDAQAYRYLPRTAARFPSGHKFVELMQSTGRFVQTHTTPLSRGICFAYVGVVGEPPARSG